jgi:eukaryotic-like serine/threonine-protein kinase
MTSAETLPLGTVVDRRYRVDSLLGAGGMGAVFCATDTGSGTRLALKVLDSETLAAIGGDDRFRREAELAQRVLHPNLVRVLAHGCDPVGTRYIAFELLDGRSLRDELRKCGPLPVRRAGAIALEVLAALEAAHNAAVVHRDLKPENVFLLRATDQVKVLDFGIAKSTNPGTAAGLTRDGLTLGTPAYMAPEQFAQSNVGPQADIFSLGVVLLEMVLGDLPFLRNMAPMALVYERLSGAAFPIPPEAAGNPLTAVVTRATEADPANRFGSAAEMAAAIRTAMESAAPLVATGIPMTADQMYAPTQAGALTPTPGPAFPYAAAPAMTPPQPAAPYAAAQPYPAAAYPVAQPYPAGPTPGSPPFGAYPPYPATPMAPMPPQRGSAAPWIIVGLFMLVLCGGAGAGFFLMRSRAVTDVSETRDRDKKRPRRTDDPPPVPVPPTLPPPLILPPPLVSNIVPGTAVTVPPTPPEPPPGAVRTVECPKAPGVSEAQLTRELAGIGWRKTGTMLYCAGDMVNFKCLGAGGNGITVESQGREGSVVPMKFDSAAAARAYEESDGGVTLAVGGNKVLRIDIPAPDADQLVARVCK